MEEIKTVDAEITNKEDDMGLTTQNQEEIPTKPNEVEWKKAKKMAAKAGHKDDKEYIETVYAELMVEKENPKEPDADEEINAVGADVPTVERPEARSKPKAKIKLAQGLELREGIDRAAIIFLAKTLLTSTDLEDFKTLYPSLF